MLCTLKRGVPWHVVMSKAEYGHKYGHKFYAVFHVVSSPLGEGYCTALSKRQKKQNRVGNHSIALAQLQMAGDADKTPTPCALRAFVSTALRECPRRPGCR
jgi:hypothetical protein